MLNWNIQWASKQSPRGQAILSTLNHSGAHVSCLTETHASFIGEGGHLICADADYGYSIKYDRRKVILWSKEPWEDVDNFGNSDLPSGRFVAGTTQTPVGKLRIIGVCIPWSHAHVTSGQKNRKPWDDHVAFIEHLKPILEAASEPTVLVGDFNQSLPRSRAPIRAERVLRELLAPRMKVATENIQNETGGRCIDHIAHSQSIRADNVEIVPAVSPQGLRLSDHFGVCATMRLA